jgi:UDP-N-acetyl-D-mannosaminuronic acid transferase (WecB/TagA/CpsF family)
LFDHLFSFGELVVELKTELNFSWVARLVGKPKRWVRQIRANVVEAEGRVIQQVEKLRPKL